MAGGATASRPPHILLSRAIDHTLIETCGIGRAVYERVFLAITVRVQMNGYALWSRLMYARVLGPPPSSSSLAPHGARWMGQA
ncbi:MAG: hypothetical protein ACRDXB_06300, partial [Actinomycetes bacterium]